MRPTVAIETGKQLTGIAPRRDGQAGARLPFVLLRSSLAPSDSPLSRFLYSHAVEVAFHTLLYIRQVYPARTPQPFPCYIDQHADLARFGLLPSTELFAEVKKYNIPIWQSRHPMLNEYLGRILECIQGEMEKVHAVRSSFRRSGSPFLHRERYEESSSW